MVHPFCCVSSHTGVCIVFIVQALLATILIGNSSYVIFSLIRYSGESDHNQNYNANNIIQNAKSAGIGMGITWIIYALVHVGLAIALWKATQQKCISRSRLWVISSSILLLVHFLLFLIMMFCLPGIGFGINPIFLHVPFMLLIAYLLWAVGIYIYEIRQEEGRTRKESMSNLCNLIK